MTIENEEPPTLTKYGRMRERYLREHRKVLYCNLLTSGKLYEHLAEIDTSARDRAEYLIKEMARKQGVAEGASSACPRQKSINFIKVL